MATTRVSRSIVALAASAVSAVYVAGYVHTQAADASMGASAPGGAAVATSAPATTALPPAISTTSPPTQTAARPTVPSANNRSPTAVATPTAAVAQAGPSLKDGTYTGAGTSRRGDVQVSVTVQAGRIESVNITRSTTQYPTRFIASLPGEVVARQSAQIDLVSGATYSSLAFRGAVQQALQRAQA